MSLNNKENSDVLVIGGGVIGMSIARKLKKNGAGKVTLLERGALGSEASFAAAGMLTAQADAEHRDEFFDFCYEGRALYEDFAAELKHETGIDVQLEKSGTLSVAFDERHLQRLEKVYDWQHAAGFPVEKLTARELFELEPFLSHEIQGGLLFPRDAQVENRLLVRALAVSLKLEGVEVFENTTIETLLTENGKISGAKTSHRKFGAGVVVLTTGAWSSLIKIGESAGAVAGILPVKGQMLSFQVEQRMFRRVIISPSGYLVPRVDNRVLAGATVETAGFDKNVTTEGVEFLLKNAYEMAPELKKFEIGETWAGLRPCSSDKLPVLGECDGVKGLYVATAHYRNGILLAPITAELMSKQILEGEKSNWPHSFSGRRFVSTKTA